MKIKPRNLKKKVRNADCCKTCSFANSYGYITINCKLGQKEYFFWKICNLYKKKYEKKVKKTRIAGLYGDSNRYKNKKGEISMIQPCMATMECYEIYCIEGELFEGIERFSTLEEAEERIDELLGA